MTESQDNPLAAAAAVLKAAAPAKKCDAAARAAALMAQANAEPLVVSAPPDRPARPEKPALAPPAAVPRRRLGSAQGRAALLHAVAHIEFNAIDLAFDMAARFFGQIGALGLDARRFADDWIRIGGEEALHFGLVSARLADYGVSYGDLPAHDGLWEAAEKTKDDVAARLVLAPMILEARGLDVTPGMIDRLRAAGDPASANALEIIYRDEIGHVACGNRWFHDVCKARDLEPVATFRTLKARHFVGALKPPFNDRARAAAGLRRQFYEEAIGEALGEAVGEVVGEVVGSD